MLSLRLVEKDKWLKVRGDSLKGNYGWKGHFLSCTPAISLYICAISLTIRKGEEQDTDIYEYIHLQ